MPGGDPVFAIAGIARPERFFADLTAAGWRVAGTMVFRDHHWFTARDVERITSEAKAREGGDRADDREGCRSAVGLRPERAPAGGGAAPRVGRASRSVCRLALGAAERDQARRSAGDTRYRRS